MYARRVQAKICQSQIDANQPPVWSVRYCIASPSFRTQYFEGVQGTVPPEIAAVVAQPGRDITEGMPCDISVTLPTEPAGKQFHAEFFYNQWNVFCLLKPMPPTA